MAAAAVAAFMHQLGSPTPPRQPNAWAPGHYPWLHTDRWRKDDQVIDFHHDPHDHRKTESVLFTDPFYGPGVRLR